MNFCYVFVLGNKPGERIGIVKQGEMGYFACQGYDYPPNDDEQVKDYVRTLNARLGVPADVEDSARAASMFGWGIPAADRANQFFNYEQGAKSA